MSGRAMACHESVIATTINAVIARARFFAPTGIASSLSLAMTAVGSLRRFGSGGTFRGLPRCARNDPKSGSPRNDSLRMTAWRKNIHAPRATDAPICYNYYLNIRKG